LNGTPITTNLQWTAQGGSVLSTTQIEASCNLTQDVNSSKIGTYLNAYFLNGKIDEFGIWNRALNIQEITNLYNDCSDLITAQPVAQSVTLSSTNSAQFTIASATLSPIFQWQTNIGLGFQNLSDAGQYSGTTTSTLLLNNITISNNNQQFRCIVMDGNCGDTTDVVVLAVEDDLGISLIENQLAISPNPATDELTITTNTLLNENFVLFDPQGRKVLSGTLTGTTTELDLSKLARGNYLIQIGEKRMPVRIVKN
jgi:hypothetical protein